MYISVIEGMHRVRLYYTHTRHPRSTDFPLCAAAARESYYYYYYIMRWESE